MRPDLRRWWLKAAAQGALSLVPEAPRLQDAARRWRPGEVLDEDYALSKWRHVKAHIKAATGSSRGDLGGARVVELGTGWFPLVAVGLALRGARVVSIDTTHHLDPRRLRLTVGVLARLAAAGQIEVGDRDRLDQAALLATGTGDAEQLLALLGVRAVIADARDLSSVGGADGADLMTSNNTLEHIPPDVLAGIFTEFHRRASATARMSHYVDLADHYAGVDPRIGEFHFLTLPPRRWRLVNNRLHYQNRLRIGDYRHLLESAGWEVVRERPMRRPESALEGLRLVPPFDTVPPRDLLVVKAHLVAGRR